MSFSVVTTVTRSLSENVAVFVGGWVGGWAGARKEARLPLFFTQMFAVPRCVTYRVRALSVAGTRSILSHGFPAGEVAEISAVTQAEPRCAGVSLSAVPCG